MTSSEAEAATGTSPAPAGISNGEPNLSDTDTVSGKAAKIIDFIRWYAADRLDSRRMDERRSLHLSVIPDFATVGLLGLQVPEHYQGQELSHTDTTRILTQLGAIDCNLLVLTAVHNTLGIPPILHFAPEPLRKEILPLLTQGKGLVTSAISEPGMGSFLGGLSAGAIRCPDGGYSINGQKKWISLGGDARYVNVFARLQDDNGGAAGTTGFLVDTTTPGYIVGPEELTLGLRAVPQNNLSFRDLRVPADFLLGEEGQGVLAAKTSFTQGRVALAAGGLGAMMRSIEVAHLFATRRNVATGRLADNGRIQQILTECVAATQAVEILVQHIVSQLDAGQVVADPFYFAAKILGCELMWQVVDRCVQLLGARGFLDTNVVGPFFRDYRLFRIFEGSTEAITVYLGAAILNSPEKFSALLENIDASEQIHDLCTEIGRLGATTTTSPAQRHIVANLRGDLGCWLILAALSSATAHRSAMHSYTAAWCTQELLKRIDTAKKELAWELPSTDLLAEHIAGYETVIGNTEQRRPGEYRDFDPLLRRH